MVTRKLSVTLTEQEAEALARFLARDFGITRNLTQYPETLALMKLQQALSNEMITNAKLT